MPSAPKQQPGQRKLARYRHTSSCIRVAGFAPGKEQELQMNRCRVLAVMTMLLLLAGVIALFK